MKIPTLQRMRFYVKRKQRIGPDIIGDWVTEIETVVADLQAEVETLRQERDAAEREIRRINIRVSHLGGVSDGQDV